MRQAKPDLQPDPSGHAWTASTSVARSSGNKMSRPPPAWKFASPHCLPF